MFALVLIAFGSAALQFFSRMRALSAPGSATASIACAGRYRPMLRLLCEDDLAFLSANRALHKTLRAQRRELFRSYLRCLAKDYANLLAGVRMMMVQSGIDRPDLARALAKNRTLFAIAICKVEFRLALHAAGVGKVEISGLVGAFDALRGQISVLSPVPMAA